MQVSNPNNCKIYNLSAGKSLPEWLSDRKKRSLQKNDIDVRQRIELIQDFEMPTVTNEVKVCPNQQYILATGVYKPRVRCYDVGEMSMKFERCMDAEVVRFQILSEDYSKLLFMQCDRYIELHTQQGRHYRIRIPKYGRDMSYHEPSCDIYFVGVSPEIYRLNLKEGRFLSPLKTSAVEINCCSFNPLHQLFTCGTAEGHIECWDPRVRNRVGRLDCALSSLQEDVELDGVPAVTSLRYKDGLNLAVGTSTGQVLLYDIRSDKPALVKDHHYGLPIQDVVFHPTQNLVLSQDSRILKMWHQHSGKAFTSIEPGVELNNLCVVPDTGMLFMANESPKIQAFYVPALGPAPKWASFLDSLTEELEENPVAMVYDDYKFVTRTELEGLGLGHLVGTSMLRAYMHGYFLDVRLYHKARSLAEPFAYDEYRKNKIREKIEEERANRVRLKKLPKVNCELAEKLIQQEEGMAAGGKKKKKQLPNLLKDERFASMFSDPDYQVDMESDEYKLLNPLVSKMDKDRLKKQKKQAELARQFEQIEEEEEEEEGRPSDEDSDILDESSSDDEHTWTQEVKKQHRLLKQKERQRRIVEQEEERSKPKFYELKSGQQELMGTKEHKEEKKKKKLAKWSLGDRLQHSIDASVIAQSGSAVGSMEMTFNVRKSRHLEKQQRAAVEHHKERKKLRRSAGNIIKPRKMAPKYYMGRRVH